MKLIYDIKIYVYKYSYTYKVCYNILLSFDNTSMYNFQTNMNMGIMYFIIFYIILLFAEELIVYFFLNYYIYACVFYDG